MVDLTFSLGASRDPKRQCPGPGLLVDGPAVEDLPARVRFRRRRPSDDPVP